MELCIHLQGMLTGNELTTVLHCKYALDESTSSIFDCYDTVTEKPDQTFFRRRKKGINHEKKEEESVKLSSTLMKRRRSRALAINSPRNKLLMVPLNVWYFCFSEWRCRAGDKRKWKEPSTREENPFRLPAHVLTRFLSEGGSKARLGNVPPNPVIIYPGDDG